MAIKTCSVKPSSLKGRECTVFCLLKAYTTTTKLTFNHQQKYKISTRRLLLTPAFMPSAKVTTRRLVRTVTKGTTEQCFDL